MVDSPRLALDYTAAIHQSAGIGRYVRELARALVDLRPDADLRLFVAGAPPHLPPFPGHATYAPSRLSERNHNRLWHRLRLPLPVEWWTGRLDLFHATDFTLPPTRPRARTLLTVHDLAFERYPDDTMPGMLAYLRRTVPRSIARADHLIAVSEATRRDLIEFYAVPPTNVAVIPHGVDSRFFPPPIHGEGDRGWGDAIRHKYGLPPGPLILTVGTLQPRKNHLTLIRACGMLSEKATLVIAGGTGWGYETVRAEVERLGLTGLVIFIGFVDDADLLALYRLATVFAYPSLYEGFGLPVLEAMASGVPVVASNVSSLPEVVGEAGLLVEPLDVDALAAALDRLLGDESLRRDLSAEGIARASQFTWARAAEGVWTLYEELVRSGAVSYSAR